MRRATSKRTDHNASEALTAGGQNAVAAHAIAGDQLTERPSLLAVPEMRYQNSYVWFVFVSSMDIMLTWTILSRGGTEVNPIAATVIDHWGIYGAIAFKFSLMLFVILVCEFAGRQKNHLGQRLAYLAVGLSSVPVVWSMTLLLWHTFWAPM